jgi:hypothetical protein
MGAYEKRMSLNFGGNRTTIPRSPTCSIVTTPNTISGLCTLCVMLSALATFMHAALVSNLNKLPPSLSANLLLQFITVMDTVPF